MALVLLAVTTAAALTPTLPFASLTALDQATEATLGSQQGGDMCVRGDRILLTTVLLKDGQMVTAALYRHPSGVFRFIMAYKDFLYFGTMDAEGNLSVLHVFAQGEAQQAYPNPCDFLAKKSVSL